MSHVFSPAAILAGLALLLAPKAFAVAYTFGDIGLNDPDFVLGLHCRNPAINCLPGAKLGVTGVLLGSSQASAEAKTNENVAGQELRIKKQLTQYYVADYQMDFGAGSFFRLGLLHALHLTRAEFIDSRFEPLDEKSSLQGLRAAASFPLTPYLRAGFHYHIYQMIQQLYGSYRFRNRPPIAVRGNLVSYGFGLSYDEGQFLVELFYNSPYVGKANVDGEDRLYTLRGFLGIAPGYKITPRHTLALLYGRYLYREDDMFARGVDPNGGTGVFLTGVALQNHILETSQWQIEWRWTIGPSLSLKALVGSSDAKAVFTRRFQVDDLKEDQREDISFNRLGAQLSYRYSPALSFTGGLRIKQTAKAVDLRDRNNTYGFRFYDQYKESASTLTLGLKALF